MPKKTLSGRLLPANTKAIEKVLRNGVPRLTEFRIDGRRGLVLLVLPSGTATWFLYYDVDGGRKRLRRKLKLGRYDDVSLARAATEADRQRALISQGADPANTKSADRRSITFGELTQKRFERGDSIRPSTKADYLRVLNKEILPILGNRAAKSVTRDVIIALLDAISNRGATRRADVAKSVISSIYAFGIDRGLVPSNATSGLRNRHHNQPRETTATEQGLRALWTAMGDGTAIMSPSMIRIVKLGLLTGLRRSEIAAAEKNELNLDGPAPMLIIPTGRAKNRNAHRVPLSPQAVSLVREALAASGVSAFVFPGSNPSHISPRSVSKAMERTRTRIDLGDLTIHDLRRTVGTFMTQLGVPRDVRERILNHGGKRKGNVTDSVYNRYEYDAEKRAALELWADALDAIVSAEARQIDSYPVRLARLKGADRLTVG